MEDDPFRVFFIQSERFDQVPRNGLSFTVLVRCQPYTFRCERQFFQLGNNLLLFRRDNIFWNESIFNVNAKVFFRQVDNMTHARSYRKILP